MHTSPLQRISPLDSGSTPGTRRATAGDTGVVVKVDAVPGSALTTAGPISAQADRAEMAVILLVRRIVLRSCLRKRGSLRTVEQWQGEGNKTRGPVSIHISWTTWASDHTDQLNTSVKV